MKSSYEIVLTYQDNSTTEVNLNVAGKLEGSLDTCRAEFGECKIRSVEIGGDGFEGAYGVPTTVDNIVLRRRLTGTHDVSDY